MVFKTIFNKTQYCAKEIEWLLDRNYKLSSISEFVGGHHQLEVPEVIFFLDSPVSNSRILKTKITSLEDKWKIPLKVELVPNPDSILSKMERVVTSDSIILDECKSWFNLSRKIIEENITNAWVVSFNNML
ncbi:DUF434 domain-containing protein [Tissierella praeacuta]|uniref:DUF434 domain-containing protein n=1 Tax=Tissierella praeacuta TaxID=43131 RepID=UPI00333E1F26